MYAVISTHIRALLVCYMLLYGFLYTYATPLYLGRLLSLCLYSSVNSDNLSMIHLAVIFSIYRLLNSLYIISYPNWRTVWSSVRSLDKNAYPSLLPSHSQSLLSAILSTFKLSSPTRLLNLSIPFMKQLWLRSPHSMTGLCLDSCREYSHLYQLSYEPSTFL